MKKSLTIFCFAVLLAVTFAGIFADWLAPFDPTATDIRAKYQGISEVHWLGTDNLGRDLFSRLVFGVRATVFNAVLAMIATLALGGMVGMVAGIFGGKIDRLLMRLCDMVLAFPAEMMILALVGMLGAGIGNILLAVVLVKWAWYARMIRGIVVQYTHRNYVHYAKTVGATHRHLFFRHLFPVALAEMVVLASADIGSVILMISALSFLGLGVQPPQPEWGSMLADAKNVMLIHPEQLLPAGIAITLTVMAFNGVGDFLRDRLDPDQIGK